MPHPVCTLSFAFALTDPSAFPGKKFYVDISFPDTALSPEDVTTCQWYLDGLLVSDVNGFRLEGATPKMAKVNIK